MFVLVLTFVFEGIPSSQIDSCEINVLLSVYQTYIEATPIVRSMRTRNSWGELLTRRTLIALYISQTNSNQSQKSLLNEITRTLD